MSELITDLETIKKRATERYDEFEVMRYMLELDDDITDEQLDKLVDDIAEPIVEAIDCTQCGNCCRSLNVYLVPNDVQRLSDGIDIPLSDIVERYIDKPSAEIFGEWGTFKQQPCGFLNGKLCTVYEHRPETCRTYPVFTPDFRWTLQDTIEGASGCPIIYNVLSEMIKKVDKL